MKKQINLLIITCIVFSIYNLFLNLKYESKVYNYENEIKAIKVEYEGLKSRYNDLLADLNSKYYNESNK